MALERGLEYLVRALLVAACAAGIWWSYCVAHADNLFRAQTSESIREAIAWMPDEPKYYVHLALLDPDHARRLLQTAVNLNPYDAQAVTHLALACESDGEVRAAERLLLTVFRFDRTYLSRWSLANFYFRHGELPQFRLWARRAVEMPAEDVRPLFELCWRANPDAKTIAETLAIEHPATLRQYMQFLAQKGELRAAADAAARLISIGTAEDGRTATFMLLNRLIQENDPRAVTLWHSLAKRHWIAADERSPYNAKFLREPLNVAFDWRFPVHDGVVQLRGPAGLQVELNGREPENCILAEQVIAIAAGAYEFNCDYRGDGMLADSGVEWQAVDSRTGVVLGVSRNLAATDSGTVAFRFTAPDSPGFVRLRLTYQRSPGTSRIAGRLALLSTQLRAY